MRLVKVISVLIYAAFVPITKANSCPSVAVRRGNKCDCSYAEARCTITDGAPEFKNLRGLDCDGNIRIDGKAAVDNGFYPKIDVKFEWKICNYNIPAFGFDDFKIGLKSGFNKFRLWNRNGRSLQSSTVEEIEPSVVLGNTKDDICRSYMQDGQIDTKIGKWFMDASLQGNAIVDGVKYNGIKAKDEPYCYAYDFTPINVVYGDCSMSTEISCNIVVNGQVTDITCQEFIDSTLEKGCLTYEARFKWNACNGENRSVKIDPRRSRAKFKHETIGQVAKKNEERELGPYECESFSSQRILNTCEKVFYSINVKGRDWDNKSKYPFIHKDCKSWSFNKLNPSTFTARPSGSIGIDTPSPKESYPSIAPSISHNPSISTFPSIRPTSSNGEPSHRPSASETPSTSSQPSSRIVSNEPSLSSENSAFPSRSNTPSNRSLAPSISTFPSETTSALIQPSIHPSISQHPSKSNVPSRYHDRGISISPNETPSAVMIPSNHPSISQYPTMTMDPTSVVSFKPTSSSPSNGTPLKSRSPSKSMQPSGSIEQDASSSPTQSPTTPTAPSASSMHTGVPSISQPPSAYFTPGDEPRTSLIPTNVYGSSHQPSSSSTPTISMSPSDLPSLSHSPSRSSAPSSSPSLFLSPSTSFAPWSGSPAGPSKGSGKGKGGKGQEKTPSKGSRRPTPTAAPSKGKGGGERSTGDSIGSPPNSENAIPNTDNLLDRFIFQFKQEKESAASPLKYGAGVRVLQALSIIGCIYFS